MSASEGLNPLNTSVQDICTAALYEGNVVGEGQTPTKSQLTTAQTRFQWMLNEWQNKRWMIWHLRDMGVRANGQTAYTIGPGGDIDTGANNPNGYPVSQRPNRLEAGYLRLLNGGGSFGGQFGNQFSAGGGNLPVDYYMRQIGSMEEYSRIAIKQLMSFPGCFFYDSAIPLGVIHPYPIPQASIYELHVIVRDQFTPAYAVLGNLVTLPFEYYSCILYNLAMRLRSRYGINTFPGDPLPGLAKNAMNTIKGSNTQIGNLRMPSGLVRGDPYNIFSDQP